MKTSRRTMLGIALSVMALPLTAMASAVKTMKKITITGFTRDLVTLRFPDDGVRRDFWITFTDVMWPVKHREGKNGETFEHHYREIIDGKGPNGGLEVSLYRHSFFDGHALKTAAKLYEHGIVLEVIKSEKDGTYINERIVTPKFETITETRAKL